MKPNNTDYNFPQNWETMSDQEKHKWYVRYRVNKQAMRQQTPTKIRMKSRMERMERIEKAKNETVDLDEWI